MSVHVEKLNMNWNQLNELQQLEEIKNISAQQKVLIFKHSTTCGVSAMALKNLEKTWQENEMQSMKLYLLDLKKHREISNQIEADFQVMHESPQVLLIEKGKAIYNASHHYIDYEALKELA